jgi:hypothetical protein
MIYSEKNSEYENAEVMSMKKKQIEDKVQVETEEMIKNWERI